MEGGLESATDFLPLKVQRAALVLQLSTRTCKLAESHWDATSFSVCRWVPIYKASSPLAAASPASETERINGGAWHCAASADVWHIFHIFRWLSHFPLKKRRLLLIDNAFGLASLRFVSDERGWNDHNCVLWIIIIKKRVLIVKLNLSGGRRNTRAYTFRIIL